MNENQNRSKPLTVQLFQLFGDEAIGQWKETEQSIKCGQEDDEQSKLADIPLLDLQSLVQLHNCFEIGTVLLDVVENEFQKIFIRVAEQMVFDGLIQEDLSTDFLKVLLLKKQHSVSEAYLKRQEPQPGHESLNDAEIGDIEKAITQKSDSSNVFPETSVVMVGSVDFLQKPIIAFVRLMTPSHFTETANDSVRFVFILLGPLLESLNYVKVGRCICTILSDTSFGLAAYNAQSKEDLSRAIKDFFINTQVVPQNRWSMNNLVKQKDSDENNPRCNPIQMHKFGCTKDTVQEEYSKLLNSESLANPLKKTHRLWGGLINDVKRRMPQYKSDLIDGLNKETMAASIFLFFGVLSTVITFGGLLYGKTENLMGVSETLLSTSLVGIVFHLFFSQPLVLVGGTGPLLLFDEALFQYCKSNHFDFLTVRIYIGLWLAAIAVTVAAFDGCVYLRLFTRFTQELFAMLICLIFMMEAVFKVIGVFKTHPILNEYNNVRDNENRSTNQYNNTVTRIPSNGIVSQPNTALFCTIFSVGTFTVAYCLRVFRNSHFLGRKIRRAIGDFGVPIGIAVFLYLSYLVPQVYKDKLIVPQGTSTRDPNQRGWIIQFNVLPIWVPLAAFIAALLVYVLIFMETQISELILDKPERALKKGSGFHLDIVIICVMNVVCGFFGLPWISGATVRSVTHVSALTVISQSRVPGDKSQLLRVSEQRISGLVISLMVGLSVTMTPLLKLIPMSVLYGVFFYMGISTISGVQFLHRIRLILTPTKYHGNQVYVTEVPTWKMHIFTFVQVLALCILRIVKSSKIALALPFVLVLMLPLRQKMCSFYSRTEMSALDGNLPDVAVNDEPDFYQQSHLPS